MKTTVLKVARIGNSRGVRLPARMLRKYRITDAVIAQEKPDEIVLRPLGDKKLSWAETFRAMTVEREDWTEWDVTAGDGTHAL